MKGNLKKILTFVFIFFFLWIFRQYFYLYIELSFDDYLRTISSIIIKFIFWIILVFVYSKVIYKENIFDKLSFKNNKKGILYAFIFGYFLLVINLAYNYLSRGTLFDFNVSVRGFISAVVFAPIIEEIVFRGYILEKLKLSLPFFWANFLTAILFVLIHFPGWLIWGDGVSLETSLSILLVSFIWGYMYKKSGSFLSPILGHTFNNLISMVV